jgi:hypothetical protein
VNRSYLSKVEKAETYVGLEIIGKLASVLDIESLRTDSALARKLAVITYRMLVDVRSPNGRATRPRPAGGHWGKPTAHRKRRVNNRKTL